MLKAIIEVNGEKIGELKIVNDATGVLGLANYKYTYWEQMEGTNKKIRRRGSFLCYIRVLGAWRLVSEILSKIKGR